MFNRYITHIDVNVPIREVKIYFESDILTIGLSDFQSFDCPFEGEIDDVLFFQLQFFSEKLSCMKKAVKALSYSALNSFKLKQKLIKDFKKDIVDCVVDELSEKKYIDDQYLASRAAESYCYGKFFGPKRIEMQLRKNGFSRMDIEDALETIPEEDYFTNMEKLCQKKLSSSEQCSEEQLRALFYKYGYQDNQVYEFLQINS